MLQTKHEALCCHASQVEPVLKKLQERYRGPEPSDMVEMFEGEQFFAAFERGISIDAGKLLLGSSLLLPLVLLQPQLCFCQGLYSSMALLSVPSLLTTRSSLPVDRDHRTIEWFGVGKAFSDHPVPPATQPHHGHQTTSAMGTAPKRQRCDAEGQGSAVTLVELEAGWR